MRLPTVQRRLLKGRLSPPVVPQSQVSQSDERYADELMDVTFYVYFDCKVCHQKSAIPLPLGILLQTQAVQCPACDSPTLTPVRMTGNC